MPIGTWAGRGKRFKPSRARSCTTPTTITLTCAPHFRLRGGAPGRAVTHLERYLATQPDDPCGIALMGAALVLSGSRGRVEHAFEHAYAIMGAQTRRIFRRNPWRLLAPGRGRSREQDRFDESFLRALLLLGRFLKKGDVGAAP